LPIIAEFSTLLISAFLKILTKFDYHQYFSFFQRSHPHQSGPNCPKAKRSSTGISANSPYGNYLYCSGRALQKLKLMINLPQQNTD